MQHNIADECILEVWGGVMTIAAVWREEDVLWCVSDTRLSRPGKSGLIVTSDSGAKIFPLLMMCRQTASIDPAGYPVVYQPHFIRRLGVVFAGNILIASQVIATVTSLCQSLETIEHGAVPQLSDIGELLRKITELYVCDFRSATNDMGTPNLVDFLLFGGCPVSNDLQIWNVRDEVSTGLSVSLTKRGGKDGDIVTVGSQQEKFRELLPSFQEQGLSRLPKHAIDQMARDGRGDVGGSIAVAYARPDGFEYCWTVSPITPGEPIASRKMNGIDLDSIGEIGPAHVGGKGMA
jgi:hypothetical protein